jgi:hypothetical protein
MKELSREIFGGFFKNFYWYINFSVTASIFYIVVTTFDAVKEKSSRIDNVNPRMFVIITS